MGVNCNTTPNNKAKIMVLTYPLTIKKKIQETPDSVSLVFDIPPQHQSVFLYQPAQFLTFNLDIAGKKYLRSYSICTTPLLNEDIKTTIKRVKEGAVSNYLIDHLKEGDKILSRKPAGRFFRPPKDLKPKHSILFAGGSGITPIFSIIKTLILADKQNTVTLFYANRNENSIIYREELKNWAGKYSKRLNIIHILSRPKESWCQIKGRLNRDHLENHLYPAVFHFEPSHKLENKQDRFLENNNNLLFYLCGPSEFMSLAEAFLLEKGASKKSLFKESFANASAIKKISNKIKTAHTVSASKDTEIPQTDMANETKSVATQETQDSKPRNLHDKPNSLSATPKQTSESTPEGTIILGEDKYLREEGSPKTIKALISGERVEITADKDIPILEQLLSEGHNPPFSCLSGSCMSCLAVLKKGKVVQEDRGILEDENIENHEILTCQAKPLTPLVEVDYDNFN